jgi:signal transduction histidine kinase
MLADVSHELRTPLTVIRGNVEGMLDGLYPVDESRLRSILEETQILSRLVDDLRTLSLAERGVLQLRREPTDLAGLIRETAASFQPKASAEGIHLEVMAQEGSQVEVDPERVREILSNLLTNALHYTPSGGVVKVSYDGGTVSVEDNGPGIAPADLPHIFERFYKASDSGGMGLGLSIAKYLAEAHGGEIRVESAPGRGTKFSFTLSAQPR